MLFSHSLGAMGYYVYMDENGDAEGNYTLIARKGIPGSPGKYGLLPIAVFQLVENRSNIQVESMGIHGFAPSELHC